MESTFSYADIGSNWQSFFKMIDLFRKLAKEVARNLGFQYPDSTDQKVTRYCRKLRYTQEK
ncbi:MAG: aminoglycoside 6-adenylyltransferase [Dehalococcoidales bacterium]|nr:aminoglycoside 6-adenylyltransferase [Dehalococcoidales bacterium]